MPALKLNDDTIDKLVFFIENGATPDIAARCAGVSRHTTKGWTTEGNKILKQFNYDIDAIEEWIDTHEEMTKDDKRRSRMCVKYVEAVKKAKANCIMPVEMVAYEKAKSGDDPRYTLEYLSRKFSKAWGKDQTLRVEGGTTNVIKQIVIHGSEEKLQLEKQNPVDAEFVEVDDAAEAIS